MFTRFNPASRRVLRAAEQASRNHNHYYVGVGHLLIALLDENDAAIVGRLAGLRVAPSELAEATRKSVGTGDDRAWDGILITPRVRAVIRNAEAANSAASEITPVSLFDALLAQDGGLVADVIATLRANAREGQPAWNT